MTYLYVITDTNDDSKKVYSVTADNFQDSKELFLGKFFPLLQNIEALDFKCLQDICKDFQFLIIVMVMVLQCELVLLDIMQIP